MAWGRVPIVGNVRLIILSERIVRRPGLSTTNVNTNSSRSDMTIMDRLPERLIVRWKTCRKPKPKPPNLRISRLPQVDKITEWLGRDSEDEDFCGLFIFEFDSEGRILSHTIEHVIEGGDWEREKGMSKVVSVTEWLLGKVGGGRAELAFSGLEGEGDCGGRRLMRGDGEDLGTHD